MKFSGFVVFSLALLLGCGPGTIGTPPPDSGDELNPNPDRVILSIWDDERPWETDADGNHYLAIEKGGTARIVASFVRYYDEVTLGDDDIWWRATGHLAIRAEPDGRTLHVSAHVDATDIARLTGNPGFTEPETIVLAVAMGEHAASMRVVAVVNVAGSWVFSADGERFRFDLEQVGRKVTSQDAGTVGTVNRDGLLLTAGSYLFSGLFRDSGDIVGTYVRDGVSGEFAARRFSQD